MSDIVERLRQGVDPDDIQETEAAMDKGAAEVERLRAALRPFAEITAMSLADIKRHCAEARAALEEK